MKRQRGWGYAVLLTVAIILVGAAAGFALGFRQGQAHPEKFDWTYYNGEGYPPEYTAGISYGTTGTLAGAGVGVLYLVFFGLSRKRRALELSEDTVAEASPEAT